MTQLGLLNMIKVRLNSVHMALFLSNDKSVGAKVEALLLYRFERINLGLGINYMKRYSGDQFMYSHRYNPWSYGRGRKAYSTDKIGSCFSFRI